MRSRLPLFAMAVLIFFLVPRKAEAHRDDYIDETFVYMTLGGGEAELEGWSEFRIDREHHVRGWYTGAFEYGITPRWTLDGAAQALNDRSRFGLGRLRFETRYRFGEERRGPLDLAVSAEFEHETRLATGGEAEDALTPRLVVSRDVVPDLNTTLNLDLPIDLAGTASFAYALGIRYPAESFVRVGAEIKQQPSLHTATVFPQVWFALPHEVTFKIGTGVGLTDRTDRLVGRMVLEWEI